MSGSDRPEPPRRTIDRRRLPSLAQQAAEGVGLVVLAALALLAFGWVAAAVVSWLL
jgi:hypothetical protein